MPSPRHRIALGATLAAALAIAAAVALGRRGTGSGSPEAAGLVERLRWTGCLRTSSSRCVRDARDPLRLLVPRDVDGALELAREGEGAPASLEYVGDLGDWRVYDVVGEPRGAFTVTLSGRTAGPLRVDDDDDQASVADVDALRTSGKHDEAIARADARLASLSGRVRVRALYTSGRAAFASGNASEAAARFRRTAEEALALGFDDDAALGKLTAAFVLGTRLGKVADALALLGDELFWARVPQVRAHRLYYRAVTHMNAANHRKAIADLRESIELHRVLGNTAEATGAAATLSSVYATLGRPLDALELVRATPRETLPTSGCTAYFFANNATFASLRAAERAGVPWSHDPAARAAAIADARIWLARLEREPDDRCSDRAARDLTRVHAAELAWLGGDMDALARALRDHREAPAATLPVVELDWRELELQYAVVRRADADVARLAAGLLDDAERFEQPHAAWAAHMARARAFGGRDPRRARADLIAAERVLDRTLADVAVGDGRNAFLSAHEASAAALFDGFLQAGELEAAAAVVERSARRAIASATRAFTGSRERTAEETLALDAYLGVKVRAEEAASHDWELPTNGLREARERRAKELADARRALEAAFAKGHPGAFDSGAERLEGAALRAPEDGDAMLYVHPSTTGYAAVLRTRRAARSTRIEGPIGVGDRERAASRIARELLGPLPRGTKLHVVAYGPLRPLDWSKLAVDDAGTRLVDHVALVEHLGLGDADAANASTGAVVVADATLDLPYAAREGALVHARVGGSLLTGSAATRGAVAGALESASFVHYAGHGRFAGADGFESELLLANGSTLAVSDVLLLARVPPLAVLSGCELSRSDDASGESFGVAQALLARGARFAIAPSRKVPDALAERFVQALYAGGALTESSVVDRMTEALRKLARDAPDEDWSTFRLLAR